MVYLLQKMQLMLKRLCRAIQLCSTTALLIFIIYVFYTSGGTQWDGAPQNMLRPVPPRAACSSNMFATRQGCVPCPSGTFSFPGWSEWTPWLNCSQIALQVHPIKRMTGGVTKLFWRSQWKGNQVVFINCSVACVASVSVRFSARSRHFSFFSRAKIGASAKKCVRVR